MKRQGLIYGSVLLIVAVMVGAAELLGEKEIIFPEITAVAVGALMAPKLAWKTDRKRILLLIMICALLGIGTVRFVPGPTWLKLTLAYAAAEAVYLRSGTSFAPMISAIALPVLLGAESMVYPTAALVLTSLILCCHMGFERIGVKERVEFVPVRSERRDWVDAGIRLAVVALAAWAVLKWNCRFAVAPPLLVAFTEFSKRDSGARKRPGTVVAAIALCGLAGAVCRFVIQMSLHLPLTLAAVAAAALMIVILERLKAYVPPAGALCILPMLIPAEAVPGYPIQILAGAALFMGLSLLLFRPEQAAAPADAPKSGT